MKKKSSSVLFCSMQSWQESVPSLLDACSLGQTVANHGQVLIKPNLIEVLQPPITTPVALVEAMVDYLLDFLPQENIIIGEGCGSTSYDTHHAFSELGYASLAADKGIQLIDLNTEELRRRENPECTRLPEIYLPEILDRVFLLSVPVLKAHSMSQVTLTMKNMMGCAPPSHYQGAGGWAKASFHTDLHRAIFDLNRYRSPDFTLLDASIGMAQAHLWGPQCSPPVGKIAVSDDPVAIDSYGTSLLHKNWQNIQHIALAHEVLGTADSFEVVEIE